MIYQRSKFLRIDYEGFGNINYQTPGASPTAISAANDGVSEQTVGTVKLGEIPGSAGHPGQLTDNRDIPSNGHVLTIGDSSIVNPLLAAFIKFLDSDGIDVANPNGHIIQSTLGDFQLQYTATRLKLIFQSLEFGINSAAGIGGQGYSNTPFVFSGLGGSSRAIAAADTFGNTDTVLV
jgi:hypothetical protein